MSISAVNSACLAEPHERQDMTHLHCGNFHKANKERRLFKIAHNRVNDAWVAEEAKER